MLVSAIFWSRTVRENNNISTFFAISHFYGKFDGNLRLDIFVLDDKSFFYRLSNVLLRSLISDGTIYVVSDFTVRGYQNRFCHRRTK